MLKKLLSKLLRETADKIDAGNCDLTESEAMELMNVLSHEALSKEQACSYLNLGRSRFDTLIRMGKLPNGRKVRGRSGLTWYKDELNVASKKISNNNTY